MFLPFLLRFHLLPPSPFSVSSSCHFVVLPAAFYVLWLFVFDDDDDDDVREEDKEGCVVYVLSFSLLFFFLAVFFFGEGEGGRRVLNSLNGLDGMEIPLDFFFS